MRWTVNLTLPDTIEQEDLTNELNEFCAAGFDLAQGEYSVEVIPAAAIPAAVEGEDEAPAAERTGTEG